MQTPIVDFIRQYQEKGTVRLHMPGHKGKRFLGMEPWDITEITGADSLYEADGIIAESEANAGGLFGSGRTFYSTEGSSQCIRAMLYLALTNRETERSNVVVAARNVHKTFVYAAALLGFEVKWLWPEERSSLCSCTVTAAGLERRLKELPAPPAAVYITSPDYLGQIADIGGLAAVCHRYGTLLVVDNAHGAYLHFLDNPLHPLDLGADLCCDSAHKTLPVLTGGAYLHIGRNLPQCYGQRAKDALALFGSTSPSYLTLASLDACNAYLDDFRGRLTACTESVRALKERLSVRGWQIEESDPLKLTMRGFEGCSGRQLAQHLRERGIECEFADRDFLVLMITPETEPGDLARLESALGEIVPGAASDVELPQPTAEQVLPVREAFFAPSRRVSISEAEGKICGCPVVSCPPAVPVVISGEKITREAIDVFRYYGMTEVEVLV